MTSRVMSDTEIRHRKKVQGGIARTTGALGLAGVGAFGAARLAGGGKVALKAQKVAPALKKINPKKADLAALGASTTAGGIGGAGSFNFASYTSAEAKKRKPAMPVTKSLGVEAPRVGEVAFAKDWKPSASKFDAERSRMERSQGHEDVGGVAAAALGAGAGAKGTQALRAVAPNWKKGQRKAKNLPNVKVAQAARKATAVKHGKVGAGLLAASGVAGAGTLAVKNRNQSRSWAPYAKRDSVSAFGVDHMHEWTAP